MDSGYLMKVYVRQLLDRAKSENGGIQVNLEMKELRKVLEQVCDLLKPQAKLKRVELILKNMRSLKGKKHDIDEMRVIQVMLNLLTNAIKFSYEGSQVLVIASIKQVNKESDQIEIRVVDSGIGISEEDQQHLF